jgi:hypothetical protein
MSGSFTSVCSAPLFVVHLSEILISHVVIWTQIHLYQGSLRCDTNIHGKGALFCAIKTIYISHSVSPVLSVKQDVMFSSDSEPS